MSLTLKQEQMAASPLIGTKLAEVMTTKDEQRKAGPVFKAFAGSMGGLIEACCLQPVDTVKTRMQLNPAKYPGMFSGLRVMGTEEGVRAMWKGLTPFAAHLYSKYALRFGTNAFFESLLADKDGKLTGSRRVLSGLGAGLVEAVVIVTPFEVIKIRLQSQVGLDKTKLKYNGPVDALVKTVKNEGFLAMWTGCGPTLWRNGLNQATMFYSKDAIDNTLWKDENGNKLKKLAIWQSMISGFLATCPGMFLTNPFDIVKTRLMVQEKGGPARYRGMMHAMVTIPREEGFATLYKGLLPRILRVPPGMAITWAVTDQLVQLYEKH
jgi:solute carrier family 25 (mitochondrial citrate transporter), member 1